MDEPRPEGLHIRPCLPFSAFIMMLPISNLWAFILGHGVRQSGTVLSTSNPSSHEPQRTQIIERGPGAGFLGCVQSLPSRLLLAPQGLAPAEPTEPQAPLLQKGHLSIKLWEALGSWPRGLTEPMPGPGHLLASKQCQVLGPLPPPASRRERGGGAGRREEPHSLQETWLE